MQQKNNPAAAQPWVRRRHGIIRNILAPGVILYTWLRTGIRAERFAEQGDRAYLILYNHQTPFDQWYVGMSFKGAVYYLATEDIFSSGWLAKVLVWLQAPIPIKKQTTDINALKTMMKVAKEGGSIGIAPEGNRTYSGKTEYMAPSIARLARKLRLPIVLYRIEGGYGVLPRWSDKSRRGKLRSGVFRVIEPEEYKSMTDEELFAAIRDGLTVNEANDRERYTSRRKAEYLERAVYVCPYCGLSTFESSGNEVCCRSCGRKVRYGEDKRLTGVGFDLPFTYFNDWYEYQKSFVRSLDLEQYREKPMFTDTAGMWEVIPYKKKNLLRKEAHLTLSGDGIRIDEGSSDGLFLPFDEITAAAVMGHNKLNIYHGDRLYQFKGSKRFNALKYVNIYYHYENIRKGDTDGEFLGL